jgi:hypothetical protein
MMSKGNDGPAFPQGVTQFNKDNGLWETVSLGGASLRDYFAASCLPILVQAHVDQSIHDLSKADIASECYSYAAFMLAKRAK